MSAATAGRFLELAAALGVALGTVLATSAHAQSLADELAWAYAITPGTAATPPVDDGTLHTLPGSDRRFKLDEIRNRMGPADWFPDDHPSMPPIVEHGREAAGVWACSLCHYPNGKGRPENAGVAGLPTEYFIQQLLDFKHGLRHSSEPRKANTELMTAFGVAMTDEEIRAAAEYFGAMPWTPWIEVVETDTVPKTDIQGGMHLKIEGAGAGTEPLGRRIVEMPKNTEYTERLRNPRSGFIAYVPKGAVARGEALTRGRDGTTRCAVCHGEDLNGLSVVPPLRGRSPSYLARALADFKTGRRHGLWSPLMAPVAASLSADDILNLSAYLASLPPTP
jgi:cytochrome c553